ncbi:hypothetical protein ACH4TV_05060 [Streptomyces sp. NPDC020898]|uniref:hypothetical protein n=1 Tax=Streptomyces sp. NPDC020898 TaxID=3365101 RepID=UPI0037AF7187
MWNEESSDAAEYLSDRMDHLFCSTPLLKAGVGASGWATAVDFNPNCRSVLTRVVAIPVGVGEDREQRATPKIAEPHGKRDPDVDSVGEFFDDRLMSGQDRQPGGQGGSSRCRRAHEEAPVMK